MLGLSPGMPGLCVSAKGTSAPILWFPGPLGSMVGPRVLVPIVVFHLFLACFIVIGFYERDIVFVPRALSLRPLGSIWSMFVFFFNFP